MKTEKVLQSRWKLDNEWSDWRIYRNHGDSTQATLANSLLRNKEPGWSGAKPRLVTVKRSDGLRSQYRLVKVQNA